MNTMKWLIRREFWEHRGGLLWAPVVVAALLFGLVTISLIVPLASADFSAAHLRIGDLELQDTAQIEALLAAPEAKEKLAEGLNLSIAAAALPLAMTMSFVVFFYFIGALYEDRANRSVLFWKSLPLSDRDTVLSKLATGLVLAPLFTWAIAMVLAILIDLVLAVAVLFLGVNVFGQVLGHAKFYTLPLEYLAILPVYVLWALPSAGWFLMVSAWARSKPFLWAVGTPLLAAMLVGWLTRIASLPNDLVRYVIHLVGRLLFSVVPASWTLHQRGPLDVTNAEFGASWPLASSWQMLLAPELWLGAAAGAAMVVTAIRLRRYRDEG